MVRIIDYRSKEVIKILRGHGQEIYALKFHPNKPHILASASGDKTIRIWNVLGAELECPPEGLVNLSENYPQGDADEGTACVGIIAGEQYGHRAEVSTIVSMASCCDYKVGRFLTDDQAFHPWHDAIASGGLDRQVKIWPLPPLPLATWESPDRTIPPGYRPTIISEPLFSTDTIHHGPLDCLDWYVAQL